MYFNENEELVISALKQTYGETWKPLEEEVIQEKIDASKKLFDLTTKEFRINQSAYNYNMLLTAMLSLQYWTQKKSKSFSITEDF